LQTISIETIHCHAAAGRFILAKEIVCAKRLWIKFFKVLLFYPLSTIPYYLFTENPLQAGLFSKE